VVKCAYFPSNSSADFSDPGIAAILSNPILSSPVQSSPVQSNPIQSNLVHHGVTGRTGEM